MLNFKISTLSHLLYTHPTQIYLKEDMREEPLHEETPNTPPKKVACYGLGWLIFSQHEIPKFRCIGVTPSPVTRHRHRGKEDSLSEGATERQHKRNNGNSSISKIYNDSSSDENDDNDIFHVATPQVDATHSSSNRPNNSDATTNSEKHFACLGHIRYSYESHHVRCSGIGMSIILEEGEGRNSAEQQRAMGSSSGHERSHEAAPACIPNPSPLSPPSSSLPSSNPSISRWKRFLSNNPTNSESPPVIDAEEEEELGRKGRRRRTSAFRNLMNSIGEDYQKIGSLGLAKKGSAAVLERSKTLVGVTFSTFRGFESPSNFVKESYNRGYQIAERSVQISVRSWSYGQSLFRRGVRYFKPLQHSQP